MNIDEYSRSLAELARTLFINEHMKLPKEDMDIHIVPGGVAIEVSFSDPRFAPVFYRISEEEINLWQSWKSFSEVTEGELIYVGSLQEQRHKAKLSRQAMASQLDLHETFIYLIEAGLTYPTADLATRWLSVCAQFQG